MEDVIARRTGLEGLANSDQFSNGCAQLRVNAEHALLLIAMSKRHSPAVVSMPESVSMDGISGTHEEANPLRERNLLGAEAVARWRGFALGWLEASPYVDIADAEVRTTRLSMLDSGCAQAEFAYGGKSFGCDLTAGAIGLFTAGTHMNRIRWRCRDVRRIIVEVDLNRLSEPGFQACVQQMPSESDVEFRDAELTALLRSMVAEAANQSPNGQLYAQSLSLGVALRLQQRAALRAGTRPERGKLTAAQLRRLEEWIAIHLADDISLAQLAQVAGFSPAHFVRLFRNSLGCSPYHHVLRTRLAKARQLLLTSDHPIVAIAAETGFASQSHLTTAFMRAFKTPPGQLRRAQSSSANIDG